MKPGSIELLSFLKTIDSDFRPSLTSKVNLKDFIIKISKKAEIIYYRDNGNNLVGLLVLYCNNEKDRISYISLVGVLKEYRGKGIARTMLNQAIAYAKEKKFEILGIHSNNPIAINLYRNLGFRIKEKGERVYMEIKLKEYE